MNSPRHSDLDQPVIARYVSVPIPVDDFNADFWRRCQSVLINHYWSGERAPVERHAEAQLCWSSEALHVRFLCSQTEPLVTSADPDTERKTLGLWDRDVCEIFLAPDPDNQSHYFEFEAAPTGEWVDLAIRLTPEGRETEWDFASGMTVAARVETGQVFVGMRIPWSDAIPKPHPGEQWRVNLFRCVGPESPNRYLAWQPTRTREPNFHVPEAFGILQFA